MPPTNKSRRTVAALTAFTLLFTAVGLVGYVWYINGQDETTGSLVTNATLAVISMISLAILAVSVFKNWEMAEAARLSAQVAAETLLEMRDVRDEESAPYIIVYFDVPYGEGNIFLVVKNIGKTEARDVTFVVNPTLPTTWPVFPEHQFQFFNKGTRSIPPGYEIRTFYDDTRTYFGRRQPFTFTVTVSYFGGIKSDKRISEQILDLTPHHYQASVKKYGIEDLVKQIEELNKHQVYIADTLSSLHNVIKEAENFINPQHIVQTSVEREITVSDSDKHPDKSIE